MAEFLPIIFFITVLIFIMLGYPVAFTLGGIAIIFGIIGIGVDIFSLLPLRIYGIMNNFTLLAVPLFIFMGIILEKSNLAESLLKSIAFSFGNKEGGLTLGVVLVGAILGATTGVVGATVVTLAVIALPILIENNYDRAISAGTIATAGTLGQIVPPSIILLLLADIVGVPVGRIFLGAIVPSLILIFSYICYIFLATNSKMNFDESNLSLNQEISRKEIIISTIPAVILITLVLGAIITGIASPTESAAIGCLGAIVLAFGNRCLNLKTLLEAAIDASKLSSMVFAILIGATAFSLVFKTMGGDFLIREIFATDSGKTTFLITSMLIIFVLGFFLDFIEICFILVPILLPVSALFEIDPLWFAILIAINLQTSFLTPPFGFSIFYLKAAAKNTITTQEIYRGVIPFVALQLCTLFLVIAFPKLITWLPDYFDK